MRGVVMYIAGLLLFCLFIAYISSVDDRREQEQRAARQSEKRAVVQALAHRWSADQGWEDMLAGPSGARVDDVLSVELQRVWFDRPILFVGTLEDISERPDGSYDVAVKHDGLISSRRLILSSFGIRVSCPEHVVTQILRARANSDSPIFEGIAVVANIDQVVQERVRDPESESEFTRIGVGRCADALYLGAESIW